MLSRLLISNPEPTRPSNFKTDLFDQIIFEIDKTLNDRIRRRFQHPAPEKQATLCPLVGVPFVPFLVQILAGRTNQLASFSLSWKPVTTTRQDAAISRGAQLGRGKHLLRILE